VATLAKQPTDPPAGRITVTANSDGTLLVRVYNAAGNPDLIGFNLIVIC
jgi:hypothetical protein